MFIVLLLAMEIAIIGAVFWYIYLREEGPKRLKSTIWGTYESDNSEDTIDLLLSSRFQNGIVVCSHKPDAQNVVPFKRPDGSDDKRTA